MVEGWLIGFVYASSGPCEEMGLLLRWRDRPLLERLNAAVVRDGDVRLHAEDADLKSFIVARGSEDSAVLPNPIKCIYCPPGAEKVPVRKELKRLTESLAGELRSASVQVNCIMPRSWIRRRITGRCLKPISRNG